MVELKHKQKHYSYLLDNSNSNKKKKTMMMQIHSDSNTSSSSSGESSPLMMSPWKQGSPHAALVGSLRREEGHIYSLAAKDGLLYTGSDGKNIRAWRNMQEFDAFKSSSGFVKAIVISGDKIFTGHQDGRIRVWKMKAGQIRTLPTFLDVLKASMRPKNYVRHRKRREVWIKHADAVSCLAMDHESGLLYSASWDGTFKVWQIHNSKCIESVTAHDDAVNSLAAGGGLVYTGSADGTVKVWRREEEARHCLWRTLLRQECAVTAVAVGSVVYCGSSDGMVNFWEVKKELSHGGSLKGHQMAVLCLAAAGNMVASGSADATVCVWRREGLDHTCLTVLSGHTGPVKCLAVEPDDGDGDGDWNRKWKVYSGSLDKSVKVWSVSETMSHPLNTWPNLELHR